MRTLGIVFLVAAAAAPTTAQDLVEGSWRGWLECPGGELPFGMTLTSDDQALAVVIHNGPERLRYRGHRDENGWVVPMTPYDSTLHFTVERDGRSVTGTWRKRRDAERFIEMPFHARQGEHPRFPFAHEADPTTIARKWRVQFEHDDHHAVGIFDVADTGIATGTFLTTLGDYRYLAGHCRGGSLALSCFDGSHAFLFRAELADGQLTGDFWSSNTWHETWTAKPDDAAALPDAYQLTEWRGEKGLGDLAFPDVDGVVHRLDDPDLAGKARILVVFGSWCPNCNDSSRFLAELHREYRDRGLSITGLAFERTGNFDEDSAQVARYIEHQGIEYPVLIGGILDKAKASQAFPLLDRVRSYPTTIFLDADNQVHTVHTGFAGPATGKPHADLRKKFTAIVEELLAR